MHRTVLWNAELWKKAMSFGCRLPQKRILILEPTGYKFLYYVVKVTVPSLHVTHETTQSLDPGMPISKDIIIETLLSHHTASHAVPNAFSNGKQCYKK